MSWINEHRRLLLAVAGASLTVSVAVFYFQPFKSRGDK